MRFKKKNKICHWGPQCRDCTSHVRSMCDHTREIPSPDTGSGQIVASMRGRMCVPGWITGLGMRGRWMEIRDLGEDSENAKKRITFRVRKLRTRRDAQPPSEYAICVVGTVRNGNVSDYANGVLGRWLGMLPSTQFAYSEGDAFFGIFNISVHIFTIPLSFR